jgi:serine/threonine-protein kinase
MDPLNGSRAASAAVKPRVGRTPLDRVGRELGGRWVLERLLGTGGTASVYEARQRNGHRAAVKVLHADLALNPSVRERFLRERYAASKVQHPGAVHVIDEGVDDDIVYLVMELLSGRSLAERLATEGPLPVADVVRASVSVLDVLAAAHDRDVIHRDVKPSNVFELDAGGFKVVDFGVAQVHDGYDATLTHQGSAVGTPAFMAPEQAGGRSDEIDGVTDLWAVGATMFHLLTGRLVHTAPTHYAALVAAASTPAGSIVPLRPDLPSEIAAVVDRALAFERGERFPNARAMRAALVRAGSRAGYVLPPSLDPRPATTLPEPAQARGAGPRPKRRRLGVAIGGAAAVVALAMVVLGSRAADRSATPPAAAPAATAAAPAAAAPVAAVAAPVAAPVAPVAVPAEAPQAPTTQEPRATHRSLGRRTHQATHAVSPAGSPKPIDDDLPIETRK